MGTPMRAGFHLGTGVASFLLPGRSDSAWNCKKKKKKVSDLMDN